MRTWIKQRFGDVLFWVSVVASVGTIACGYSTIRASQVKTEEQIGAVVQRLDKLEARLEKLVDLHVHDQQGADLR